MKTKIRWRRRNPLVSRMYAWVILLIVFEADLFPETTIMICDMVRSLTFRNPNSNAPVRLVSLVRSSSTLMLRLTRLSSAWSSGREPSDVFQLLENVYGAFDVAAKRWDNFVLDDGSLTTSDPQPSRVQGWSRSYFCSDICLLTNSQKLIRPLEINTLLWLDCQTRWRIMRSYAAASLWIVPAQWIAWQKSLLQNLVPTLQICPCDSEFIGEFFVRFTAESLTQQLQSQWTSNCW